MPMPISQPVLAVLSRCSTEGNALVLPEQLDRKMYLAVMKVIDAAGGVWSRKAKSHVFPGDAEELMDAIINIGEITDVKKEMNAFFTPIAVTQLMVTKANINQPRMVALEPSCGVGNIVGSMPSSTKMICVEEHAPFMEQLKARFPVGLADGTIHPVLGDFLKVFPNDVTHKIPHVDRVLMNPPFSKGRDVAHVLHALQFLKPNGPGQPGGRLVSIMGAGVTFREDRRTQGFWAKIKAMTASGGGYMVDPLPAGSFAESGTMVNTVMLTVQL